MLHPNSIHGVPRHKQMLKLLQELVPADDVIRISSLDAYKEIQTLGKGRFGPVLKYMDRSRMSYISGKRVNLAMFDHWTQDMKRISARLDIFVSEFRALHKISMASQRIANFVGLYSDNEQMVIFSEYLPNGSVKDKLMKESLSEETALRYLCQTIEALNYLHSMTPPIVHRDIKASNLLITISDSIKVANFGLVRDLAVDGFGIAVASEITLDFRGTLLYVAPEVLTSVLGPGNRNAYGLPADIWALGCTFVEMLTRQPPHFEYFGKVDCIQKELIERATGPVESRLPFRADVLVPTSTDKVKRVLDQLFEIDPVIRPTAQKLMGTLPGLVRPSVFSDFYEDCSPADTKMLLQIPSTSKGNGYSEKEESAQNENRTDNSDIESSNDQEKEAVSSYTPLETLENGALRRKRTVHLRKKRRRGKTERSAICFAYHSTRCLYFTGILSRAIFYVTSFLTIGVGTLFVFLGIAFGIVWLCRQAISHFCNCNLMNPQYLIISGILLILLFALLFSCCMVALGEYKFRKANRTLEESRWWRPRPKNGVELCGVTVVKKLAERIPEEEESDAESIDLPQVHAKLPTNEDQSYYYEN